MCKLQLVLFAIECPFSCASDNADMHTSATSRGRTSENFLPKEYLGGRSQQIGARE